MCKTYVPWELFTNLHAKKNAISTSKKDPWRVLLQKHCEVKLFSFIVIVLSVGKSWGISTSLS